MPFTPPAEPLSPAAPLLRDAEWGCSWVRRVAVAVGVILGGSNLLIWLDGSVPAFVLNAGMMVMRFNTAIGITAAALSLACWSPAPGAARRGLARAFALVAALIGVLTAIQDIAIVDLGVDQLFAPGTIPGDIANEFVRAPGRMSLNAALSLMFLGMSLFAVDWDVPVGKTAHFVGAGAGDDRGSAGVARVGRLPSRGREVHRDSAVHQYPLPYGGRAPRAFTRRPRRPARAAPGASYSFHGSGRRAPALDAPRLHGAAADAGLVHRPRPACGNRRPGRRRRAHALWRAGAALWIVDRGQPGDRPSGSPGPAPLRKPCAMARSAARPSWTRRWTPWS